MISLCVYVPNNPGLLFCFLDRILSDKDKAENEVLIWVDNDDHKTSFEFYALRKYIRKGLNLHVFVNPAVESQEDVFKFLASKAHGSSTAQIGVVEALLVEGILKLQEGVKHEKA